ncbi:type II toxin-antitoxin system RelE/ParE family toxin [Streptococcus merionis]|uniref:type II toxin-antitoxin system RelE/ParE family toxin n=1 Tax=Streptococcus merionis TaxID=400065 RepID=UPI003511B264
MKKPKFEFYTRPNGRTEFIEFLQGLPPKDKQKLLATIAMIQEHGLLVAQRMEWVKKLDKDIFEIRSKVSSNIQRVFYFHVLDDRYIITHGFTKKTQKTPAAEIEHAKELKREFEENDHANY